MPDDAIPVDHDSFTELVGRYDRRLRGLAYQLLGGDAQSMDDVLQDAYLKAYRALPRFRRDADPGSWLYRIVYNASMDELRRRKHRPQPVDATDVHYDRPDDASSPGDRAGDADAVIRALRSLPDDQRATLVLVDGQGFDTRTAAGILGVADGTVRSRLSRARAAARQVLIEERR